MRNDLDLRDDVLRRLELEPKIDPAAVMVSVEAGVVTLTGTLEEDVDRQVTEKAVRDISGVKGLIADDLRVKCGKTVRPKDAELVAQARESIQWLTTVPQEGIRVSAKDGWLTVEGDVEFLHQVRSIGEVLRDIQGVHGVRNKLTTARQSQAA